MRAENLSVAAAFDLSYRDLTAGQRRLFRRLGLHPGPDIDAYAAAALDGTGLASRPPRPGGPVRPAPADRARPRPLPAARPGPRARPRAGRRRRPRRHRRRDRAAAGLLPAHRPGRRPAHRPQITAARRRPAGRPPCAPRLATPAQARAWLEAERANLHAAAGYAAASGQPRHARLIPAAMAGFLHDQGHWDQAGPCTRPRWPPPARPVTGPARPAPCCCWASAALTGDFPAAAASLDRRPWSCTATSATGSARPTPSTGSGFAQQVTGDYPAAAACHRQALELFGGPATGAEKPRPSTTWAPCTG